LKYFIAFLITIILHISLYFYLNKKDIKTPTKISSTNKTTNIQYVRLKSKSNIIKKSIKNKNKKKLIKKIPKKNKTIKKTFIKKYKKKPILKAKKFKKQEQKSSLLKSYTKKTIIKKKIAKEVIKDIKKEKFDKITKEFIDLYGKEFDSFDNKTKKFLINNIKDIGFITQRYLEYPYLSVQTRQSGVSVVEFYLNPNGTISKLKTKKSSGYFLLDDNTIETIQEAYSEYPRPKKPTLIKIFVKYILK